jgi:acyl carrier protein
VVRGYFNRPDLTAERFLPDPFAGEGRMYRTGDRVRALPDGNLEFLGRTDSQVKLRGYRIELGEIESVLEALPEVQQAVVTLREHRPGDQRLVANVVSVNGTALTPDYLRGELQKKLPEYMIPAHYILLQRLPMTPNGKIDRNALPAGSYLTVGSGAATSPDDSTLSEIERTIANVWMEALGLEHVGSEQNIFDLGATSLLAVEVQLELQRRLNREVSLVDLFEFHTVRALAQHLTEGRVATRTSSRASRRLAARGQQGPS